MHCSCVQRYCVQTRISNTQKGKLEDGQRSPSGPTRNGGTNVLGEMQQNSGAWTGVAFFLRLPRRA